MSFEASADDTIHTSQDGLWKYRVLDDGTAEIYGGNQTPAYFGTENNLVIPYSIDDYAVSGIGDWAFLLNNSLVSIYIGENIKKVGVALFAGCSDLDSIVVDSSNTHYCAVDNVLFDINMESLISYAAGKPDVSYTVPDGVRRIERDAFTFSSNLTSVVIPDTVDYIGAEAFVVCTALSSVTLPNGIDAINDTMFFMCSSLTEIEIPSSVTYIDSTAFSDSGLETIKGYYDSAAETFANDNGFTFVSLDVITPGDFNTDESVTLSDYSGFISYLNGDIMSLSKVQSLCADIDGDGAVDAFDLFYLDKMINSQ